MNLSYHNDPFPHIVGSLDEELYSMVLESWDDLNDIEKEYNVASGNRSNIQLKNEQIKSSLNALCFDIHSKFIDTYLESYPKLLNKEFRLDCRILYSENKPSEDGYKISYYSKLCFDRTQKNILKQIAFEYFIKKLLSTKLTSKNPFVK